MDRDTYQKMIDWWQGPQGTVYRLKYTHDSDNRVIIWHELEWWEYALGLEQHYRNKPLPILESPHPFSGWNRQELAYWIVKKFISTQETRKSAK